MVSRSLYKVKEETRENPVIGSLGVTLVIPFELVESRTTLISSLLSPG